MAETTKRVGIEFSVKSNTFNNSISTMKKELQLTQTQLINSAREVNLYGKNLNSLASQQNLLNKAIKEQENIIKKYSNNISDNNKKLEENKKKLEELKAKKSELNKAYKDSVKANGQENEKTKELKKSLEQIKSEYTETSNKIKNNEKAIQNNTQQMEKSKGNLLNLQTQLKSVNKEFDKQSNYFYSSAKSCQEAGDKYVALGGKISGVGSKIATLGTSLVAGTLAIGKFSTDFEKSMAKVNTIMDDTQVSFEDMQQSILDLSNKTGINANDVAENVYNAISAGQNTKDATAFVGEISKLSKAGFTESSSALDIVTTIENAYKMTSDETSKINDILIQTQNKGKVTVDELSQSLGQVIPTAKSAGLNIENVASSMILLTKNGIKASEATTYLNSLITELNKSDTTASNMLKQATGGLNFNTLIDQGKSLGDVLAILSDYADECGLNFMDFFDKTNASKAAIVLATNSGKDFAESMNDVKNSTGACDSAFKKMSETSQGKMNKAINEMKNSFINLGQGATPLIESLAKGIDSFANVLSKIPPKTLETVAKIGMFTLATGLAVKGVGKMVSGLGALKLAVVPLLNTLGKLTLGTTTFTAEMSGFAVATKGVSVAFSGLKTILLGNPLGLLITGIVSAIAVVDKLDKKIHGDLSKSINDCKDQSEKLSEGLSKADSENDLMAQYKSVTEELQNTNLTEQERIDKNNELKTIKDQLIQSETEYGDILKNQNLTIDEQIEKMKKISDSKLRKEAEELDKNMMGQNDIERKLQNMQKDMELYKKIQDIYKYKMSDDDMISWDGSDYNVATFKSYYVNNGKEDELINNINDANAEIEGYNANLDKMAECNYKTTRSKIELSGAEKGLLNDINNTNESIEKQTENFNKLMEKVDSKKALTKARQDFSASATEIKQLTEYIKELQSGEYDDSTLMNIIQTYPQLAENVNDRAVLEQKLTDILNNQKEVQKQAYQTMIENSEDYYRTTLANNEEFRSYESKTIEILNNLNNQYFSNRTEEFRTNWENAKTFAEKRRAVEIETIRIISEAWTAYYKIMKENNYVYDTDGKKMVVTEDTTGRGTITAKNKDDFNKANGVFDEAYSKVEELEKLLTGLDGQVKVNDVDFKALGTDLKDTTKKAVDYTVEALEDMTDAYYNLKNSIDDVKDSQDILDAKIERSSGSEKVNLMKEKITLMQKELILSNQLISKYSEEAEKQKQSLIARGVLFGADGNISNRNELLASLIANCNAMESYDEATKKAKENQQSYIKQLEKDIESWTNLTQNDLTEQQKSYEKLLNSIQDAQKEIQKLVSSGESKISDIIKKELEDRYNARKESIEKTKKLIQDEWNTDDYNDQLQEAQDKIMEYEDKITNAIKLGDSVSLKSLVEEQNKAKEELNDLVKQHERNSINDEFDKQIDNLEEEYKNQTSAQNITDMVTKAMKSGFIEVNGEVISLSDAMKDFINDSVIGVQSLNTELEETTKTIQNAIAGLNSLGNLNLSGLTLNDTVYKNRLSDVSTNNYNSSRYYKDVSISSPITVNVNGNLDNVTLEDVNNTISKRFKEVVGNYIS